MGLGDFRFVSSKCMSLYDVLYSVSRRALPSPSPTEPLIVFHFHSLVGRSIRALHLSASAHYNSYQSSASRHGTPPPSRAFQCNPRLHFTAPHFMSRLQNNPPPRLQRITSRFTSRLHTITPHTTTRLHPKSEHVAPSLGFNPTQGTALQDISRLQIITHHISASPHRTTTQFTSRLQNKSTHPTAPDHLNPAHFTASEISVMLNEYRPQPWERS